LALAKAPEPDRAAVWREGFDLSFTSGSDMTPRESLLPRFGVML
jgi:hypothetical protein